jgi:hypothetical protein
MKKQLHNKFLSIVVIAILFSASANAQIVYTDVNPDVTSTSTNISYNLDLNNDGTNDFEITSSIGTIRCTIVGGTFSFSRPIIRVSPLGTNQVAVAKLELNTNINSSILNWSNNINQIIAADNAGRCGGRVSTWLTAVNGYLPLSLISGGNTYYGWARLDTSAATSFTIKDYAYNSVPNQPILAGQTSALGIDENSLVSKINIFPNPASNQVTISLGSLQQVVALAITDTTGKIVYKTKESETQNIKVNTTDFANGIYLVQIKAKDYVTTKKLVVNK